MSEPANLRTALAYAQRGWLVFPCFEPNANACACGHAGCSSPAKHPRVAHGLKAATGDFQVIQRWWTRWPRANVAIRTGAESGVVVVDVDPRHGGSRSLSALLADSGPLPDGPVVATGGGGVHAFFAHPGNPVRNDAGRRLGAGLDVRGDGGYVIAPPSVHIAGRPYEWLEWRAPLPDLPGWLERAVRRDPAPPPSATFAVAPSAQADANPWAEAALAAESRAVASAVEGTRNATLNRAAFRVGQLVSGVGLERLVATEALVNAARAAGLGEREAQRTVESGLTAGELRPRAPAANPERHPERRTAGVDVSGP